MSGPQLKEVVAELKRELGVRIISYPGEIDAGRLSVEGAHERTVRLEKGLELLQWLQANGEQIKAWRRLAAYVEANLQDHPAVAAVLKAFPEASISAVRQSEGEGAERS